MLDPKIKAAMEEASARASVDGGFQVSKLPEGTLLSVVTSHNVYRIVVIDPKNGDLAVDGGALPEPRVFRLNGSTLGGSIIRPDWIGAGMFIECPGFRTSEVQSVIIEDNPVLAKRITEQVEGNTFFVSEEKIEEALQKFLSEKLPDPLVCEEVKGLIKDFCPNGKIALASFFVRAQGQNRIIEAFDVFQGMNSEVWGSQHPEMRGDPELGNNEHYLKELYARAGISIK